MAFDATEFRAAQRTMWSTGDWPSFATTIQPVADALIERVDVQPGQDVLDIGTGSGNAALRAAQRGGRVIGSDITPELFDAGRQRATEAGVEIDWVEADAADLPFEDDSFDVVLTIFGAIFAPRHQQAADEMVRVCRPGGTIAVCGWTPEGLNGQMLKTFATVMPTPPPEVQSPILWGDPDHVTRLFADRGVALEFERTAAAWEWESATSWFDYLEQNLGPAILAKRALEPTGEYERIRDEQIELFRQHEDGDGRLRAKAEYLRSIGRVAA
jgi:ubiquinone/menaquinone biosynthesis C-methylase UbiE